MEVGRRNVYVLGPFRAPLLALRVPFLVPIILGASPAVPPSEASLPGPCPQASPRSSVFYGFSGGLAVVFRAIWVFSLVLAAPFSDQTDPTASPAVPSPGVSIWGACSQPLGSNEAFSQFSVGHGVMLQAVPTVGSLELTHWAVSVV